MVVPENFGRRVSAQALLDEKVLAACLAYVDLNPIRAGIAETPETSEHTSIKQRVECPESQQSQPKTLYPFVGYPREPMPDGLPFRLSDYLELVDWTGRVLRDDKRGHISHYIPPILDRLEIDAKQWRTLATQLEKECKTLVGEAQAMRAAAQLLGYKRTPGIRQTAALF